MYTHILMEGMAPHGQCATSVVSTMCVAPGPMTGMVHDQFAPRMVPVSVTSTGPSLMRESWYHALQSEFQEVYFSNLSKFLDKEFNNRKIICPLLSNVFYFTQHCDIKYVRVVILGQDPYPTPRQADGLAFSVPLGVTIPQSLKNIYAELTRTFLDFKHPRHGNLFGWASQGVLLLNSVLTVEEGEPKSHQYQGWEQFTDAIMNWISTNLNGVVFMLWGKAAGKKEVLIKQGKNHLVLITSHPSPRAQLRALQKFIGCYHFVRCNNHLIAQGKGHIVWSFLPPC